MQVKRSQVKGRSMSKLASLVGWLTLAGLAVLQPACGNGGAKTAMLDGGPDGSPATSSDGGGNDGGQGDQDGPDADPRVPELTAPGINLQGGTGLEGGGGGSVHLLAVGDLVVDPSGEGPTAPTAPPVPAGATNIAALSADVMAPGSVRVGHVVATGSDPVRTISAAGDLFITGTLRAADLGAGARRQSLVLSAPAGTVYVSGSIDTSGADGAGQDGGDITIDALRVVITGHLDAAGGTGSGAFGGRGGAVLVTSVETLVITGGVATAGGDDFGGGAGGPAGSANLHAGSEVGVAGRWLLRGGAGSGVDGSLGGGQGGTLSIHTDGAVTLGGIIDLRGGHAVKGKGKGMPTAGGGAGGALIIGDADGPVPTAIAIVSPVVATGGQGEQQGGSGGSFRAEAKTGNVTIRGQRAVDVSGGSAASTAGAGGMVYVSGTEEESSGNIDIQGELFADGGGVIAPGAANGADSSRAGAGGRIEMPLASLQGAISIAATGILSAVGGRSEGSRVAGDGGEVLLSTDVGDITLAGSILVTGGAAAGPGGTGGLGGRVVLFSDRNGRANRVSSGNVLVAETGLIEASGGAGTMGGHARNDGMEESVAGFPSMGDQIAVLLDCDNVTGKTMTWLENRGRIVARGGMSDGNGGDVIFHGRMADGTEPVPGDVDTSAHGRGINGDFGSD